MMIQHELIQTGCFVYQVVRSDKVVVRATPDLTDDDDDVEDEETDGGEQSVVSASPSHFENNELLAVDLIQPTDYAVFLRLADQSGWVVAEQYGELYLRRLEVEQPQDRPYCFYVDYPGLVVRRQPMDDSSGMLSSESGPQQQLHAMQKIYCDARVQHPVTGVQYYRLQNSSYDAPATPGWVHDKQIGAARKDSSGTTYLVRLLDESMIKIGLFAFRAVQGAAVRKSPDCLECSKIGLAVQKDELVVVDMIRESPYAKGNGPFLRLADGAGWLFEHKMGERILESVEIQKGLWNVMILNEPVGLGLRTHPVDRQDRLLKSHDAYLPGTKLECDAKIVNQGVTFYRVRGTPGWLFDKRGDTPMLELLSTENGNVPLTSVSGKDNDAWSDEFVRGIVATVPGVKELSNDTEQRVMTFENADKIQVHVFCRSKSVCTVYEHPVDGKIRDSQRDCTPKQLHSILGRNTVDAITSRIIRKHTEGPEDEYDGEEKKEEDFPAALQQIQPVATTAEEKRNSAVEKEEALRKDLLLCDTEIAKAQEKRLKLVKAIKGYDNERAAMAVKVMASIQVDDDEVNHHTRNGLHQQPEAFSEEVLSKPSPKKKSKAALVMNTFSNNSLIEQSSRSPVGGGRGIDEQAPTNSVTHLPPQYVGSSATFSSAGASMGGESSSRHALLVCRECFQTFSGKYSRDLHCRQVHKLFCGKCDRIFVSLQDLEAHKDIAGHW